MGIPRYTGLGVLGRQPGAIKVFKAIALNQSKRLRLIRRERGGNRVLAEGTESAFQKVSSAYERIAPLMGDVRGKVGLEIGPGDNLGVADCFLANGAKMVYAIDRLATVQWSEELHLRIYSHYGGTEGKKPKLRICTFEETSICDLDFIYSIDVMEHVGDFQQVFRKAFASLKPGGMFVNAIDFSGHNMFELKSAPLNFLVCPDWLYNLMHSHIVTSNRCRIGQVINTMKQTGFIIEPVFVTRHADENYVRRIRPRLLPRFRSIPVSELTVLEAIVVAQKPHASAFNPN